MNKIDELKEEVEISKDLGKLLLRRAFLYDDALKEILAICDRKQEDADQLILRIAEIAKKALNGRPK